VGVIITLVHRRQRFYFGLKAGTFSDSIPPPLFSMASCALQDATARKTHCQTVASRRDALVKSSLSPGLIMSLGTEFRSGSLSSSARSAEFSA